MDGTASINLLTFWYEGIHLAANTSFIDRIGSVPTPVPEQLEIVTVHTILDMERKIYQQPVLLYLKESRKALQVDHLEDIIEVAYSSLVPLPLHIIQQCRATVEDRAAVCKNSILLLLNLPAIIGNT